jgi:arylsulfatase A-like enzyme
VGAFLDGLRERGIYDDALIVFTSDHGEEFFDHGGWWHGQTLYDEVLGVPLIVKLPGNEAAGTARDDLVQHVDLAPTLLALAGAPVPEAMQGRPLFGGDAAAPPVYAHNDFEGNLLRAVRTPAMKLIEAETAQSRDLAPLELYDLREDPAERDNLVEQRPQDGERLGGLLDGMRAFVEENAEQPVVLEETPAELQEQLEAVGYM